MAIENRDIPLVSLKTYLLINETENSDSGLSEFLFKPEFDIKIVKINSQSDHQLNIWNGIMEAVEESLTTQDDFVVISLPGHRFSPNYNRNYLIKGIIDSYKQGCDVLFGGIHKMTIAVPLSSNRYWIEYGEASFFFILFKRIFTKILKKQLGINQTVDSHLSELTSNKMILYPFISENDDYTITKQERELHYHRKLNMKNASLKLSIYKKVFDKYIFNK